MKDQQQPHDVNLLHPKLTLQHRFLNGNDATITIFEEGYWVTWSNGRPENPSLEFATEFSQWWEVVLSKVLEHATMLRVTQSKISFANDRFEGYSVEFQNGIRIEIGIPIGNTPFVLIDAWKHGKSYALKEPLHVGITSFARGFLLGEAAL